MTNTLRRLLQRARLIPTAPAAAPPPEILLARQFAQRPIASASGVVVSSPRVNRSELKAYFSSHREGRGIWKWEHYFDVYERHLARFVGRKVHVAEIGVYSGGSLEMWRHYFGPDCRVTGIDIQEACRSYENEHTSIVIGDQEDREFWGRFREQSPAVDVLIDDGGHAWNQQRVTLEEMLPHIAPGGVYICEDIHGIGNRFATYTQALADELNAFNPVSSSDVLSTTATSFQRTIGSIHFYPFAVVIEKNERIVDGFTAPKRGTRWEPFLS